MTAPAHYAFLPWYRAGLAAAIDANPGAGDGDRGVILVQLETTVGGVGEPSAAQRVRLIGPGDVIGIDPRAVVRVDPPPNAHDFEPNYLAAIEFFDEDFAWRYSPRAPDADANARLLPWLALVVLQTDECDFPKDQGGELPRAVVVHDAAHLPAPDDLWAWAHTHLNAAAADLADPAAPKPTAAFLRANPALGLSRLVAARRLRPNTSYRALLVPAFEAGRRAGLLPADTPARLMAWGRAGPVTLPVYHEWSFRTGVPGDFEKLARLLHPVLPDPAVGRRHMDLTRPLPGLATPPIRDAAAPAGRPVLDLEGALQLTGASASPWEAQSRADFQTWLAGFVNLAEAWTLDAGNQVAGAPVLPHGIKLPVVLPPSYGRWHADVTTLEPARADDRWLEQLNLDPRNRVAAAFGTLVVQKNQEAFVARAWAQYGALFLANRYRHRAQLMREVLTAAAAKHLAPLAEPKLLAATGLAHARVLVADALTVRGAVEASALPNATVRPAMRRVLRERGPLARRFGAGPAPLTNVVSAVASTAVRVAPAWAPPAERLTLATPAPAPIAAPNVPPNGAPDPSPWLGGEWDALRPLLVAYLERTVALALRFPPLGAIVAFLRELIARGDAQSAVGTAQFTPAAVAAVRERAGWVPPTLARDPARPPRPEDTRESAAHPGFSFAAAGFRQAALNGAEWLTLPLPDQPDRPALDVGATAAALRARLSPYATVAERVARVTQLPPAVRIASYDPLETIMAYPTFDDPTYEHLRRIAEEYVVPNLSKITNNSITLLESNWRFVESFLVGLNHEMARELLWRGYRTDQRGTYFARFWDHRGVPGPARDDIQPIHGWKRGGRHTPLGENRPAGQPIEHNLVLVVRGDLLRRYPNLDVVAVRAVPNDPPRRDTFAHVSRRPGDRADKGDDLAKNVEPPVLFARFAPDMFCFGFNLEADEARGDAADRAHLGWYFALAERFGEPRFGLDEPADDPPTFSPVAVPAAADLSWAHLVRNAAEYAALGPLDLSRHAPVAPAAGFRTDELAPGRAARWNTDAADMAALLLQLPFRLYFHANDMLPPR